MSPEIGSAIRSTARKAGYVGGALVLAAAAYGWGVKAKIESSAGNEGVLGPVPQETPGEFKSQAPNGSRLVELQPLPNPSGSGKDGEKKGTELENKGAGEGFSGPLKPGEVKDLPAGAIAGGDFFIGDEAGNEIRTFDDLKKTGSIIVTTEKARIRAVSGGFVIFGFSDEEMTTALGRVAIEMAMNGCENGCNSILFTNFPGSRQLRGGPGPAEVDRELQPGETMNVPANSVVKGDVELLDGTKLHDNRSNTGAIVEIHKDTMIRALFGANVSWMGEDEAVVNLLEGSAVRGMKKQGCGDLVNGCDIAEVYKVGLVPDLSGGEQPKKKSMPKPGVTPIATPIPTPIPKPK